MRDLRSIWRYTEDRWGAEQAQAYLDRLEGCCDDIVSGKAVTRLFSTGAGRCHVSRCQRHYIFYVDAGKIVIAILHERMDLLRRLKDRL